MMNNYYLPALLFITGAGLLAVNFYGLTQSLRNPALNKNSTDFSTQELLDYDETMQQLKQLDLSNPKKAISSTNEIIHKAMLHVSPESMGLEERTEYNSKVPVWENYLLYIIQHTLGAGDKFYEFTNYQRALERGIGLCGQQSLTLIDFLSKNNFNTGIVNLNGHVVATAEVSKGKWYIMDPDFGIVIPHSADELKASPALVEYYYKDFPGHNMAIAYSENKITYGGSEARYPKASLLEDITYILIWLIPVLLIFTAIFLLSGYTKKRKTSCAE